MKRLQWKRKEEGKEKDFYNGESARGGQNTKTPNKRAVQLKVAFNELLKALSQTFLFSLF